MKSLALIAIVTAATLAGAPAHATLVAANQASVTDLGSFAAGTYTISGSGLVDLVGPPGSGFTMRPDGIPDSPVTASGYSYFNPSGSFQADGNFGPGGAGIKIGALMGSLSAAPTTADFFLIGYGANVTLASAGHIYAQVNDTYYSNNGGAFSADVAPVPEAASWAMMIAGFGLVGGALRRRRIRMVVSYG